MPVWIALGKLALAVGLMFYTLITMCGGNPMGEYVPCDAEVLG